jgi:hypothetical protein
MDKKNNKRNKKSLRTPNKGLKTPAVPVPPTATELSEEDLKRVTGGVILIEYTEDKHKDE